MNKCRWFTAGDSYWDRNTSEPGDTSSLSESTMQVSWGQLWKNLTTKESYEAFTAGVSSANDLTVDRFLVLRYTGPHESHDLLMRNEYDFYAGFADVCLSMADLHDEPHQIDLQRKYLLEANDYMQKALDIIATNKAKYGESEDDDYHTNPSALPNRIAAALAALPEKTPEMVKPAPEPVSRPTTQTTAPLASSRKKPTPVTISSLAKAAKAAPAPKPTSLLRTPVSTGIKSTPAQNQTLTSAQQALEREDYAAAEALFENLCDKEPKNIDAFIGHGLSLLKLAEQCEQPRTRKKQLMHAQEQLKTAESLDTKGRYPQAEALLSEVETKLSNEDASSSLVNHSLMGLQLQSASLAARKPVLQTNARQNLSSK